MLKQRRNKGPAPPLDREGLERLAIAYVGRYATTRAKLRAYLARKLNSRGWSGPGEPPFDDVVGRMAALGLVDDASFATAKAASMTRRGLGERRVDAVLRAAGVAGEDSVEARAAAADEAWAAAVRFAQRKKIGPYAIQIPDRAAQARQFAMMMRAGHRTDVARRVLGGEALSFPEGDDL